jgi:hypothetical protein
MKIKLALSAFAVTLALAACAKKEETVIVPEAAPAAPAAEMAPAAPAEVAPAPAAEATPAAPAPAK